MRTASIRAAYVLLRAIIGRKRPYGWVAGFILGLAIALPSVIPFVQFLKRSGWLISRTHALPLRYFELFVRPDMLGNRAYHNWTGDWTLGALNNYIEITVYAGLVPLLLAAIAIFRRRARWRWFWFAARALMLATCSFQARLERDRAPSACCYSPLTRLQLLLPLPIGSPAAGASCSRGEGDGLQRSSRSSSPRIRRVAGKFYPYSRPISRFHRDATIAFLQKQPSLRIAPFMNYRGRTHRSCTSSKTCRSHFSSEAAYRRCCCVSIDLIEPISKQ